MLLLSAPASCSLQVTSDVSRQLFLLFAKEKGSIYIHGGFDNGNPEILFGCLNDCHHPFCSCVGHDVMLLTVWFIMKKFKLWNVILPKESSGVVGGVYSVVLGGPVKYQIMQWNNLVMMMTTSRVLEMTVVDWQQSNVNEIRVSHVVVFRTYSGGLKTTKAIGFDAVSKLGTRSAANCFFLKIKGSICIKRMFYYDNPEVILGCYNGCHHELCKSVGHDCVDSSAFDCLTHYETVQTAECYLTKWGV